MSTPIFRALAEAALIAETAAHRSDLGAAVPSALVDQGRQVVSAAMTALTHVAEELQDDKLAGHLVHTAATEQEMWLETARFRAKKVLGEGDKLDDLMGKGFHGPDHTVTVIAQAVRFMAVLRLDTELRAEFESHRIRVDDLLQRGNALLIKLIRLAEDNAHPVGTDADTHLDPQAAALQAFLGTAGHGAARALADEPFLLGLLGVIPEGTGLPLGGTASRVTRHQKSARKAPSGRFAEPASGWSVGRQNRNNENQGKGYA